MLPYPPAAEEEEGVEVSRGQAWWWLHEPKGGHIILPERDAEPAPETRGKDAARDEVRGALCVPVAEGAGVGVEAVLLVEIPWSEFDFASVAIRRI